MAIQWYPGHMHKAQKQIKEVINKVDLVIEVLDARIPFSSSNPMIESIRGEKPCIKLLNKEDLADPKVTQQWLDYYNNQAQTKAMALTTSELSQVQKISDLCRKLVPHKNQDHKTINAMIMGIPNVGKSTLINALAGRVIAKTGNEPAVTKAQQRINLKNGIVLSDTPGMLWPKIENESSGYRLAVTGAIRDTAIDYEDVAFFAVEYLGAAYPEELKSRYKISEIPEQPLELMEAIGRHRGAVKSGHKVNYHKVSELILHEFRSGKMGQLSLETPEMAVREIELTQKKIEEKQLQDLEKKAPSKKRKKR
jgi:ribosome biogenesis GTPase A